MKYVLALIVLFSGLTAALLSGVEDPPAMQREFSRRALVDASIRSSRLLVRATATPSARTRTPTMTATTTPSPTATPSAR